MGSSLSRARQEEHGDQNSSSVFCCFGRGSSVDQDLLERTNAYESNKHAAQYCSSPYDVQPQPRPQSARIRSDRAGETTTSGQWFASAIEVKASHTVEPPPVARPNSVDTKKRKRSLSQVLNRRPNTRRPLTAPGRSHPAAWRVSLHSWGPTSPFPDFSTFAFEVPIEDDDSSSCTYVDALSRRASHSTPVDWPLPNSPTGYPILEARTNANSEQTQETRHTEGTQRLDATPAHKPLKASKSKSQSTGRSRALSEPFRYVRRARPSLSRNERKGVNDEIQELQSLVEARRAAFSPVGTQHERNTSLTRVKSKGHVPAIAPSMKVSVRSQVLNDIGSAFSKPFPSGQQLAAQKTPEMEADAATQVSPPREASRPEQPAATSAVSAPEHSTSPASRYRFRDSVEQPTPRSSVSSIATTASDVSASQFPTASSTPPLSRSSPSLDSPAGIPPPPTRKAPAPPDAASSRGSKIITGIWTAARDSLSGDIFHSRGSSQSESHRGPPNFRISDIRPPPPLKATLKQQK